MMLDWQGRVAECTGANIFFVKRRQDPHADRRLFPRRHHAADRDRAGEKARLRSDRAPHHAGRARRVSPNASSPARAAEVTAVAEIADWNFNPGGITKQLMEDYTAAVKPKGSGGVKLRLLHAVCFLRPQQRDVAHAIDGAEMHPCARPPPGGGCARHGATAIRASGQTSRSRSGNSRAPAAVTRSR